MSNTLYLTAAGCEMSWSGVSNTAFWGVRYSASDGFPGVKCGFWGGQIPFPAFSGASLDTFGVSNTLYLTASGGSSGVSDANSGIFRSGFWVSNALHLTASGVSNAMHLTGPGGSNPDIRQFPERHLTLSGCQMHCI